MKLAWTVHAWEDYLFWQETDLKITERINLLIKDIIRSPFIGIGKPEPLKLTLAGKWSRRINDEHRLIYEISGKKEKTSQEVDSRMLIIYQCRLHY